MSKTQNINESTTGKTAPKSARSAAMTGAEILREALLRRGVEHIFGYPGAASVELHHCFDDTDRPEVLLTRHEQGAAFAAQGYARSTGRAGVCMATSGPGATNLLTGIQGAMKDSIPLLAITGQVATDALGTDAFQETNIVEASRPMTRWNYQLQEPGEIPAVVAEAFRQLRDGRPGPVLIDFPVDVQQATARPDFSDLEEADAEPQAPEPDHAALSEAADLIKQAERPVICAGGGVIAAGASDQLREFARRLGIPVATTLKGLGAFPETDELALKLLGMHGTEYANLAVDNADLLVGLGTRFSDRVTGDVEQFAAGARVVHVDVDPAELDKNKPADIAVRADAGDALASWNRRLEAGGDYSAWRRRIAGWKEERPLRFRSNPDEITPQQVCRRLGQVAPDDAIVASGVGQHQMFAAQYYNFSRPRTWLSSSGLGAMGFGYPAALGAKTAQPDREVVLVDGDGSFLMNPQELGTAAQHDLAVKAIVLNNRHLGMVTQFEDRFYDGHRAETELENESMDFVGLARSFGLRARRVSRPEHLGPALDELLAADGPAVLEVEVPYRDDVLPMIPAGGSVDKMIVPDAEAS